jgi:hypothetical protein
MNHLGCDGSMRVVFDAGDAKLEDDEDKVDEEEEEVEEHMKVDISKLKSQFCLLNCIPFIMILTTMMKQVNSYHRWNYSLK